MVDKEKLLNYLTTNLVNTSRKAHKIHKGSRGHSKLVKEMEVLTRLIKLVEKGKFAYEYEVLEKAVNDFDNFINLG